MTLQVSVAGKSDVGCVRTNNEDNFGYDSRYGIYVVSDGMGGAAAGEVASKMAVDSILTSYRQSSGSRPTSNAQPQDASARSNALRGAIESANRVIFSASQERPSQAGMGSTIVAVSVEEGSFSIGHVGDSRIYLVRAGAIQQLTNDHSLVMEQVRRGLITLEDAQNVDYQNIVIKALGAEATVEPDLDDMLAMEGDELLLCTDGLTRHLTDEQILDIVTGNQDLSVAVDALIDAAKIRGGADNITALLLRFENQSWVQSIVKGIVPGGTPKWQDSM